MLSVKIGQFHPSLENSFVNTIQTLKKDDPLAPLAVVTPTNWILNRLQERLVHEQDASFVNISFMNFYALANEVCRRSGTDSGKIIQQSVIYECLIAGLLKRHTLPGSVFKNVQSLPALANALFQAIRDLADANVDADDLKEAIREGFIDDAEMQKLYGVVHLYDMFKQKLKTLNISHFSDLYRLATTCVSDSRFLKGFRCILVYGLYDPTGAEQDFFGEIFRSHPTTLFLPYQKKHPVFSYVKPFFESFVLGLAHDIEEIATDDDYGFSYIIDPKSKDNDEEMRILTASQTRNPNIHIINASGKRDEVWIIAKEILKLLDEGYKMEEIGVVARTLEPYTDAIKKIFQENRIPFTTNSEEPLERYPLVKVIRQLLLLKREDYYRPIVIELLGSPYFKIPSFDRKGITPRPDLWDLLSRRAGIRGDIKRWLSRLEQWKATSKEALNMDNEASMSKEGTRMSEEKFTDNEIERRVHIPLNQIEFLENTLRILSNDLSSIPEKASWTVMSQKTTHLLQRYICVPLEGMNREEQKRDQQILNKISELLHTLCIMDCLGEEVTQDQFVDTLINACRQEGLPIGIENDRGVKVMDAMSARGVPFRTLFVLGLNEKVFPRAISEEPFLRDHVRRRLSEVLGNHIPEKLRGFDEERLLFYFLLNAARERLYLLYERSDEAGKPKIPSHYLMDIRQNIKESSEEKTKHEVYMPRGIKDKLCNKEYSLLTPKEIGIRMALDRIDPDYFRKAFGLNRDAFARSQSALGFMESDNPQLTAYDGIVGDMSHWWDKRAHHGLSPTALEIFGTCPFKFFMGKILELESLEEPEKIDTIEPVDLGALYHNILRDFYNTLIEQRYFATKTKKINPEELLQDIAQKYFTEIERQIPIPYPIVWEVKKEEILAVLTRFITWDIEHIEQTGYIPAYLERSVKRGEQDLLLKPAFAGSKQGEASEITFKGKIDRIDLKPAPICPKQETVGNAVNFRIVDYKSGKVSRENLTRAAIRGQKLQLPFYIILAEHLLSEEIRKGRIPQGQTVLDEASFVYIAQDMGDKKGQKGIPKDTIKGDDWKACEKQCWETLEEFLQYIREGTFPISSTEDAQKCEWCEFSAVCRRGHQPLRFRLEHDARLKKRREIDKLDIRKKSNKS